MDTKFDEEIKGINNTTSAHSDIEESGLEGHSQSQRQEIPKDRV